MPLEGISHDPWLPVLRSPMRPAVGRRVGLTPIAQLLQWLYGAGEQGIAVPDLTPGNGFLFQDSAGTTPVTAYEQPVGLILDRSKGLVLGPELFANQVGSFSNSAGGATATYTSGTQTVSLTVAGTDNGYPRLSIDVGMVAGRTYQVIGRIDGTRTGISRVRLATVGSVNDLVYSSSTGVFQGYVVAASPSIQFMNDGTVTGDRTIAALSVRELPGNHIIQATSTKRPTLSARYNLLTRSEEFDNAAWTKINSTVTANSTVAPDGTTTADSLIENTSNNLHFTVQIVSRSAGAATFTYSLYVKAIGTDRYIRLIIADGATSNYSAVFINPINGTATGSITNFGFTNSSLIISDAGNGWYRVALTATTDAISTNLSAQCYLSTTANNTTYTGDGTSGIYIWGADLRRTIDTIGQPAYQRVGASNDYDTAGFFPYLLFDGTDDSMATAASVDFTGTNKMTVFAGVTKLSDAAVGILTELSSVRASNNGAFTMLAPGGPGANYTWASKGTADAVITGAATAPVTNVVSGIGDISAKICELRVNGTQAAFASTDQGTGNFGNYTMFFGARNNASNFFNGRLYPFFIRGAATDAGLIAQVEPYIRARMPVSF